MKVGEGGRCGLVDKKFEPSALWKRLYFYTDCEVFKLLVAQHLNVEGEVQCDMKSDLMIAGGGTVYTTHVCAGTLYAQKYVYARIDIDIGISTMAGRWHPDTPGSQTNTCTHDRGETCVNEKLGRKFEFFKKKEKKKKEKKKN